MVGVKKQQDKKGTRRAEGGRDGGEVKNTAIKEDRVELVKLSVVEMIPSFKDPKKERFK